MIGGPGAAHPVRDLRTYRCCSCSPDGPAEVALTAALASSQGTLDTRLLAELRGGARHHDAPC